MKNYKKSFIKSNLLLIGLVLFIMNAVIMVYSYHTSVDELKTVMQQKIEPYNTIRNILKEQPRIEDGAAPEKPDGSNDKANDERMPGTTDDFNAKMPPHDMPENDLSDKYSKSVYVFFYNIHEENVSIVSKDELQNNNELLGTAQKIYAQTNDFGFLKAENLYYYKQSTPNELKISIASGNFILFSMLELFAVLMFIFFLAMLIFYFISKKLANRAAKPLEDAIAREKQFITDASHDLKTPLTVILSNADILSRNQACTVSEMSKWIDFTKQAASNMKELIEQMKYGMPNGEPPEKPNGESDFGAVPDREPPEKPENENDLTQAPDKEPSERPNLFGKEMQKPDGEPPAKPESDGESIQTPDGEPPEKPDGESNFGEAPDREPPEKPDDETFKETTIEISKGDTISIATSDGTVLETVTADKDAKGVVFSSDALVQNETYTLFINGEAAATAKLLERMSGENGIAGKGDKNPAEFQKPFEQNLHRRAAL